jgi:hypothetical protein
MGDYRYGPEGANLSDHTAGRKQLAEEVKNFDFLLANIARVMEGA